jgi:hypothetical protein
MMAAVCLLTGNTRPAAGEEVFQQGLNGYTGVVDQTIDLSTPTLATRLRMKYLTGQEYYNTLIRFEGLDVALADQLVQEATLTLTFQKENPQWLEVLLSFHPCLRPWNDPNWVMYDTPNVWALPGGQGPGDRGPLLNGVTYSMGPRSFPSNQYPDNTPYVFPLPAKLVQSWIDNPAANHGLLIAAAQSDVTFSSSEDAEAAYRPKLSVVLSACDQNLPGDFNRDCQHDAADVIWLAEEWLMAGYLETDLTNDGFVDLADFALLAAAAAPAAVVPDVVGLSLPEAETLLLGAGLQPQWLYHYSATVPVDVVVSQDPPAGTGFNPPAAITVTLSRGPVTGNLDASNNVVDLGDFAWFAGEWGQSGNLASDLDNNGTVELADLVLWSGHWLDELAPE